jgi:formyl-CoA transferase
MTLPLDGISIIDLTRARAGPTAVRQLADMGASVIKVESREDPDQTFARHGFDFQNLHRNKRSLTLDLKKPEGVAILKKMIPRTDVVVENYRPDVKRRLGIDYETLSAINPRLIYGSISGFGQTGPYRDRPGYDQIAQGLGGLMSITGLPGQGPVRVGIPIADLTAGIFLAQGILVALYERTKSGKGQWVHTSLLEAMVTMLDFQASRWLMSGEVPPQAGNNHPTGIPTGVFETKDGHINIAAAGDDLYDRFCRAIDRPDLRTDPRFATARARSANRDLLMELLMPVTRQKSSAEWIEILNDAGVPCGPIYRVDEAFADPQVEHLRMAQPVRSPVLGDITILGHPVSHGAERLPIRSAAPELGQDNEAILTSLGYTEDQIADLARRGII